ncbi:MAG TPA: hypothetical protein VG889_21085 [Rhizomicrobium sp.]|nr:hypothetical protein [Rhizomicrobium sp.]
MTTAFTRARALACAIAAFAAASPAAADAILLASGLNAPPAIALDGNGGRLFFSQLDTATCDGELDRIPASGGALQTIGTGFGARDGAVCRGLTQLLFTSDSAALKQKAIYGWSIGNADYATGTSDLDGNPQLLTSMHFGTLLGVLGGDAYYSYGFCCLATLPVGGGGLQNAASGYFVRSTAFDPSDPNYAPDAAGIYFINYFDSTVYRYDLTSQAVASVMQGLPTEGYIATDSRNVYWSDDTSALLVQAKGASCVMPACTALHTGATTHGIAVDEAETDNPAGSVFFSTGTKLYRAAKTGGTRLVYGGADVLVLATDGAQVYFTDGTTLKSIPVNATSPSKALTLASAVSPVHWTLNDGLYWTDSGDGSPGAGKIFYVVQQASQLDALQYSTSADAAALQACAALPALYATLARTVLEAQGLHVAATGVKFDDFYRVVDSGNPCASGGGAADWSGNGVWQNPVQGNVAFAARKKATAATDLAALLAGGPVMLQGTKSARWLLATNAAVVTHGSDQVAGISAYDPLSGSRLLLQPDAGSYHAALILDPRTNVWCAWAAECPNLVKDIKSSTLKFISYDLGVLQDFAPKFYITTTVRP